MDSSSSTPFPVPEPHERAQPTPCPPGPATDQDAVTNVHRPGVPILCEAPTALDGKTPAAGHLEPPGPADAPEIPGGRYRIEEAIGRGGMGVVYRAFDRELDRHVAIKVIGRARGARKELLARFLREAKAGAQLEHPGIVPVYDVGVLPGQQAFFAMRLVRGRTLADITKRVRAGDAELAREYTLFRLLAIFVEVARTVACAHEAGIVHRDLKPENIMVGSYGEVQVLDWGLAKMVAEPPPADERRERAAPPAGGPGDPLRTAAGQFVGTPAYASPEQAQEDPSGVGPLSDVFSLGATLAFVLTGAPPYKATTSFELLHHVREGSIVEPRSVDPSVPRALEAICLKAMALAPSDRYGGAGALADDVQAYLEGRPVTALREGITARARRVARRHQAVVATALVALVLGLAAAIGGVVRLSAANRLANLNLAEVCGEMGRRARDAGDPLAAEAYFARALLLDDRREFREGLIEAAARGVRLLWQSPERSGHAALAATADGRLCASAGADGRVRVFDVATGHVVAVLEPSSAGAGCVAWTPDGRRILAGLEDGTVRVFDLATRAPLATLTGHRAAVCAVAVSADGKLVATGSLDRTVRLRDLEGREVVTELAHSSWVYDVAFSADGRMLASASWDGARIFSVPDGAELVRLGEGRGDVNAVAFTPDGRKLLLACDNESLELWDIESKSRERTQRAYRGGVLDVAMSPDARLVATISRDRALRVLFFDSFDELLTFRAEGLSSHESQVAFTPGGVLLASGLEGRVRAFDLGRRDVCIALEGHGAEVSSVAFTGPRKVVSTGWDGTARTWDAVSGRVEKVLRGTVSGRLSDASVIPDLEGIAAGGEDGAIHIFEASSGRERLTIPGARRWIFGTDVSRDGRRIAAGYERGQVSVFDAATGKTLFSEQRHKADVLSVAFHPGGRLLASSADDGAICLWDLEAPGDPRVLRGHGWEVSGLAFSPDGTLLASGGRDKAVRLWSLPSGRELRVLRSEWHEMYGVAFSPDGSELATADESGTIRLFEVATGREVVALRGHIREVIEVAFSPDGQLLASASWDRRVLVWKLDEARRVLRAPVVELAREAERNTGRWVRLDAPR